LLLALAAPSHAASPVPATPLPGQKVAPCSDEELEINKGCWRLLQAVPRMTDAQMQYSCSQPEAYERHPGDCLKKRQIVVPVLKEKPAPAAMRVASPPPSSAG
jgi:hypothetical protein